MVVYSIRDLEKLSGVKAHTLRIWEKRYGIINPKRTETNIRYYLDDDLKKVLNIALLNKQGMKISKIAALCEDTILKKVAEISAVDEEFEVHLDALTLSLLELNEYKFNKILDSNIEQRGFKGTMTEVIYPLLDKLSLMWMTQSINQVQEKFVTANIRRKTIAAIDKLPTIKPDEDNSILIYLPKGEDFELSLLYLHFVIKEMGYAVTNLGVNVVTQELEEFAAICKPKYVSTIINTSLKGEDVRNYITNLQNVFLGSTLLLSGFEVIKQKFRKSSQIHVFNSMNDIISSLETH